MSINDPTYEFFDLKSEVEDIPRRDEELVKTIRSYSFVLQHTLDRVEVLMARDYEGLPSNLLELRAFDENGELHVVDVEGKYVGRVRTDGRGSAAVAYDEFHEVWGSQASVDGETVVLTEDRGTYVCIPLDAIKTMRENVGMSDKERVVIRVRNYLDDGKLDYESGDTNFVFEDYRLVCFCVKGA